MAADYDDEPAGFWSAEDCFYAEIELPKLRGLALENIEGMSGGPLLTVERTEAGQIKYRLAAVQSSWLPERRIIRTEFILKVLRMLQGD